MAGYLIGKRTQLCWARRVENAGCVRLVAILGGAKVADKLKVINNLLDKVDTLIIGGGMAYTFLAAEGLRGRHVAAGRNREDRLLQGNDGKSCEKNGVKLLLPVDTVHHCRVPQPH